MKRVNSSRTAAILAAMVMMTGCGSASGGTASEVKLGTNNLAAGNDVPKSNVEYVTRFDDSGDRPEDKENAYYGDYVNMDKAALKMLGKCLEAEKGGNVLISPFSIEMAFGMVENGANGNNLSEMEKVIGGGVGISDMNKDLGYLSGKMSSNQDVNWNVANSIWVNTPDSNNIRLKDDYLKTVKSYYAPVVTGLPFDDKAKDTINEWVSNETYGMIPTIIGETPQGSVMLINAVAFKGEWNEAFTDDQIIEDYEFTNDDGEISTVTMLSGECDKYFTFGRGQGFQVDYKGGEYSFVGILPPSDQTLSEFVNSLIEEDESIVEDIEFFSTKKCYYKLPEFKTEYSAEMVDPLKSLGINNAFDPDADFSKMWDGQLYISRVIHKTYIDVNREGTEAAAATAIEMTEGCVMENPENPIVIELDRPFIYLVIDNETNMPIFMGAQNTMK